MEAFSDYNNSRHTSWGRRIVGSRTAELGVAREIRKRIAGKATNQMAIKRLLFLSEVARARSDSATMILVSRGMSKL